MTSNITAIFNALYAKLNQKWPLSSIQQSLSQESFELFYIHDVDTLLDELIAKGEEHPDMVDERVPYWADLWASAIGLARFVIENRAFVQGKKILEIGCGIGLPGIAAGRCGAEVCLTDYLDDALQLARLNWLHNMQQEGQFELLDWRQPRSELQADILLASDVAYEERAFMPLRQAFPALVRPGGELWLSEPNRAWAKPFFASLRQQGEIISSQNYIIRQESLTSNVSVYRIKPGSET